MPIMLQHIIYLDCEPDKLFRWALESAGVSAPPRTITSTTWRLLRERKGENGYTPERCLAWLLFQFPAAFRMNLLDGTVARATNVSFRLQKADSDWNLNPELGNEVSEHNQLTRDLAVYAKRPGRMASLRMPRPVVAKRARPRRRRWRGRPTVAPVIRSAE